MVLICFSLIIMLLFVSAFLNIIMEELFISRGTWKGRREQKIWISTTSVFSFPFSFYLKAFQSIGVIGGGGEKKHCLAPLCISYWNKSGFDMFVWTINSRSDQVLVDIGAECLDLLSSRGNCEEVIGSSAWEVAVFYLFYGSPGSMGTLPLT